MKRSVDPLHEIVSISIFNEVPLPIFRDRLSSSLLQVLEECRQEHGETTIIRYNPYHLRDCFLKLNWTGVCWDYDETARKKASSETSADNNKNHNLLDEVLSCLSNPCVWPDACNLPILDVLLNFLVFGGWTTCTRGHQVNWLPSQQRLLHWVSSLAQTNYALQSQLCRILSECVNGSRSSKHVNLSLSLIKYFFREFRTNYLAFLASLADLLVLVDLLEAEHSQLVLASVQGADTSNIYNSKVSTHRAPCASVALLHGESSQAENDRMTHRLKQSSYRRYVKAPPSYKKLLESDTGNNAYHSQNEKAELSTCRPKCIKVLISKCSQALLKSRHATNHVIDVLLERASNNRDASSIVLSTLILSDHVTESFLLQFVEAAISRTQTVQDSDPSALLSIYAEVIVEARHFDNDNNLWLGLKPLLDKLLMSSSEESSLMSHQFTHCFAYILSRRGTLMSQRQKTFQALMAQLSNIYYCTEHWLHPNLEPETRQEVLEALQISGILGFCDVPIGDEAAKDDTQENQVLPTICPVPFPTSLRLRRLSRRLETHFPYMARVFSIYSPTNSAPGKKWKSREAAKSSLNDVLQEDTLRHIFSFLSYKRLTHVRLVCSEWKRLADSRRLWHHLYKDRFGFQPDDPFAILEQEPWKRHFIEKWQIERELRFCQNRLGWTARPCGYVGCHQAMRSQYKMKLHYEKHQREIRIVQTGLAGATKQPKRKAKKKAVSKRKAHATTPLKNCAKQIRDVSVVQLVS